MRAVIYIRLSKEQNTWVDYDFLKVQALEYCRRRGYDVLLLIGLHGSAEKMEQYGQGKLLQLAERDLIDVIVIPKWRMISESYNGIHKWIEKTAEFGAFVDCVHSQAFRKKVWLSSCRGRIKPDNQERTGIAYADKG